jgi:hypothetical protein
MGESTQAIGWHSISMGVGTKAIGDYSSSLGISTKAKGMASTATGMGTVASGTSSSSMGYVTIAKPFASLAIGQYNDTTCSVNGNVNWVPTDPLLIIGNGNGSVYRNAFTVLKNGNTAIGHASPTEMLDVDGNARFRNISSGAYAGTVNRTSDGTLTMATSDISTKENICTLSNGLNSVMNLRGISFTWKTDPEMGTRIGFIAQEVEKVLPELVFTNPADGLKGVNYAEMTAVLVEAVKEQQNQIEDQQKEIDELKALVNNLVNQTMLSTK